eukprot:sb/3473272/
MYAPLPNIRCYIFIKLNPLDFPTCNAITCINTTYIVRFYYAYKFYLATYNTRPKVECYKCNNNDPRPQVEADSCTLVHEPASATKCKTLAEIAKLAVSTGPTSQDGRGTNISDIAIDSAETSFQITPVNPIVDDLNPYRYEIWEGVPLSLRDL